MFKLRIICLGKFKEQAFADLEREYLKRLKVYGKVIIDEIKEVAYSPTADMDKIKAQEAELILKHLPKDGIVLLLEEKGVVRNSVEFAKFFDRLISLNREIVCILGSGAGLHESLKEHANHTISLSPLTFTHNFARVLLEEQIYRACTILQGKEYHK